MYELETLAKMNKAEDLKFYLKNNPLKELQEVEDAVKSPDYSGVDVELLQEVAGLTLVDMFFVDSSGFGKEGEDALTLKQFYRQLTTVLINAQNSGEQLVSALTGIGQFQVDVSIFRRNQ